MSFSKQSLISHKYAGLPSLGELVGNTAWKLHNHHFEDKKEEKPMKWKVVYSIWSEKLMEIYTESFEISNLLSNSFHKIVTKNVMYIIEEIRQLQKTPIITYWQQLMKSCTIFHCWQIWRQNKTEARFPKMHIESLLSLQKLKITLKKLDQTFIATV